MCIKVVHTRGKRLLRRGLAWLACDGTATCNIFMSTATCNIFMIIETCNICISTGTGNIFIGGVLLRVDDLNCRQLRFWIWSMVSALFWALFGRLGPGSLVFLWNLFLAALFLVVVGPCALAVGPPGRPQHHATFPHSGTFQHFPHHNENALQVNCLVAAPIL